MKDNKKTFVAQIATTEKVETKKTLLSDVKTEHLGKVSSFEGCPFVLSAIDLVRQKAPPQNDIVIKAATEEQLEYLFKTHRFLFK